MNKYMLIIVFSFFCLSCSEIESKSLSQKKHTVKQVGVSVFEGEKYSLIITSDDYLFIARPGNQTIGPNFEFTVKSAELLLDDSKLIDDLGLLSYENDKYIVDGIEAESVLIQMDDKCFRSNLETKELTPCD